MLHESVFVLCTRAICRLCECVTELGPSHSLKCSFNFLSFSLCTSLLSSSQLPSRLGKESSGKRGRRSNFEEGKPRRKRGEPKVCDMHPKLSWFRYDSFTEIWSSFFNSWGSITFEYFFSPELSFYLQWNDHTLNELHWIWWLNWPPFVQQQSMMLDADGGSLWPNGKLHICEHCSASFRSSYHLRRHVLIHTGTQASTDWSTMQIFLYIFFLMKVISWGTRVFVLNWVDRQYVCYGRSSFTQVPTPLIKMSVHF